MSVRPIISITPAEDRIDTVHQSGFPFYFTKLVKGYSQGWLQYMVDTDDLAMVFRTSYAAKIEWDGQECHEIRVEYYEPEFPDARMTLYLVIAEHADSYEIIRWTQYYPGSSATSMKVEGDSFPKVLATDDRWSCNGIYGTEKKTAHYCVGGAYDIDISGRKRLRCILINQRTSNAQVDYYVDPDGNCLLQQFFSITDNDKPKPVWVAIPDTLL